jgi:hypothetical protein
MIAVIVLFIYQKVRNKNVATVPYNLRLPNWLLITIGSVCFFGGIIQIVLRAMRIE